MAGGDEPTGLAAALRRHRRASGLTQEQVAERAGLSVRTISDLERGIHATARRATLERLVPALGLGPADAARLLRSGVTEGDAGPAVVLPASLRARPDQPPLVGREQARARFADAWARALAGERLALVFSGEAGIGKSRLIGALATELADRNVAVLAGRCDDSGNVPFGALLEALRPHLRDDLVGAHLGAVGPDAGHLALVLPELEPLVAAPPPDADPGTSRARLLDALEALVASMAGVGGPVVLVIDDLQAADPSTLAALRHLVRSGRPEGFLLIAGYRDTEVTPDHPLPELFEDLQRDRLLLRTELTGLDEDALGSLVARVRGERPDPALVQALHRETGGNPFFVEEVLSHASEQGISLEAAIASVPAGARDVVRARVRRLSPAARDALAVAAVVGDAFDARVVERVAGPSASGSVAEAAASGFVRRDDHWSFRHGIVRAALLADLDPSEAVRIHWAVGTALEDLHRTDADRHLEEIAFHLGRGAAAGDRVRASEHLARVGRQQFRAIALDEAVASLTAALEVVPEAEDDPRRRMSVLETLAETHFWRDDPDAMRGAAVAAADLARRHGSAEDLARTVIVAARWNRGGELDPAVLGLLDEAVARFGDTESGLLAQLLAMRAYVLQGAARGFETRRLAEEAEVMARRSGDTESLALTLLVQTYTEAGAPTVDRTRRIVADLEETAAQVLREDLRRQYGAMALRSRALLQLTSGDRIGYEATRAELGAIAESMRARFIRSQMLHWDAAIVRAEGRFDAADELSAAALATWSSRPDAMRVYLVQSANSGLERGEHDRWLPEIERAIAGNTSSIGYAWRAALTAGLAAAGRTAEATARLEELGADKFRALAADHQRPHALRWLSEAIARLGHTALAEVLLPVVEPYTGLVLVGSGISSVEAAADRAIGQLLATLGRAEDAGAHYARAEELEQRLGFEALALRTRSWSAALLVADPVTRARGVEIARTVADRCRTLGMALLAREAGVLSGEDRSAR